MQMDRHTHAFFSVTFERDFLLMRGEAFQDWFSCIMEKCHPGDFIRVRPWGRAGDRKNDGYLRSERTIFQVYAPNEMSAADAVAKIEEDFHGAFPYWEKFFDVWVFTHNSRYGLGPDVTRKLLELDDVHDALTVKPWGY